MICFSGMKIHCGRRNLPDSAKLASSPSMMSSGYTYVKKSNNEILSITSSALDFTLKGSIMQIVSKLYILFVVSISRRIRIPKIPPNSSDLRTSSSRSSTIPTTSTNFLYVYFLSINYPNCISWANLSASSLSERLSSIIC